MSQYELSSTDKEKGWVFLALYSMQKMVKYTILWSLCKNISLTNVTNQSESSIPERHVIISQYRRTSYHSVSHRASYSNYGRKYDWLFFKCYSSHCIYLVNLQGHTRLSFYCIFDQVNAAFESSFKNMKNLSDPFDQQCMSYIIFFKGW